MSDFDGKTTRPKARKDRKCIWCGALILKGETYVRWTGKFQGEFQSNAYHAECHKAALTEPEYWADGFEPFSFARGTTDERGSRQKETLNAKP